MDRRQHRFGFERLIFPTLLGMGIVLVACNGSPRNVSNEQLQQQSAKVTEQAKQQSKEALQDARIAAANAEQKVNAIAAGVREGVKDKAPANSRIDLNSASQDDLAGLPGISEAQARQIIRHRPYTSTHQLVDRGILSDTQFDAISSDIKAE